MLLLKSPAKINLFLRIVRQEINGYHYLQTLFQFTSIYDEISFELRNDNKIIANYHNDAINESNDLIVKAIYLLQQESNITQGLNITLKKNIPMGAGLGGGSSNAATALMATNQLYNLNYSSEKLQFLGKQLGADVPIFIYGKSAWAEGIGEQFVAMNPIEKEYVLVIPPISISTQQVFQFAGLARNNPRLEKTDHPQYINDCTSAIFALYPKMQHYMEALSALGLAPKITGTGSCIYIELPNDYQQEQLTTLALKENLQLLPFSTSNTNYGAIVQP